MIPPSDAQLHLLPGSPIASLIRKSFIRMSVLFAINHGCVTSVLSLAVYFLGSKGAYMSGTLYVTYAMTALVASSAIVESLGSRGALIAGSALYCVYVMAFPLALIATGEIAQYLIAVGGGTLGGIAAGFLWTAQGAYFGAASKLHAAALDITPEAATSSFAALFGGLFLGFEVLLKALPLGIKALSSAEPHGSTDTPSSMDITIATVYSVLAIASAIGMTTVRRIESMRQALTEAPSHSTATSAASGGREAAPSVATPTASRLTYRKLLMALLLWCRRPAVVLLAPVQITFGLCAALLQLESPRLLQHNFPPTEAGKASALVVGGLLFALIALTAAVLQYPFKMIASRVGKPPLMLLGLCAFASLGLLFLVLKESTLQQHGTLVALFILQGIGRACFEGTNKAIYADFFPDDAEAAFSNIVLANGGASAVVFFVFGDGVNGGSSAIAISALVSACVAIVAYLGAECVHRMDSQTVATVQ